MTNPGEVAAALRGTVLDGLPTEEGLADTVIIEGADPGRLLEAWRAAHAVLPVTGRWPVFTLPGGLYHEPGDEEIAALDEAARTTDPWAVYRRTSQDELLDDDEVAEYVTAFLGPDLVSPALGRLRPPVTAAAVQRWTYDTLLADPPMIERVGAGYDYLVGTSRWHVWPQVQLVLLPTTTPWLAPAWVSYFGAAFPDGQQAWAAAMREWHERWGAGLVAAWGTMLQFVTERRPEPGPPAWELAGQLLAVGGSLECERWQLALALTRGDAWFLHDRP